MADNHLTATISVRGVMATYDDHILVLKCGDNGHWELPGGRLEPDEHVIECLRREIGEETGMEVLVHSTVHANTWYNDEGHGRFAVYYRCTPDHRDVRLSDEHIDYEWLPISHVNLRLPDAQAKAVHYTLEHTEGEVIEPPDIETYHEPSQDSLPA